MRNTILLVLLLILSCCTQNRLRDTSDKLLLNKLDSLVQQHDYFRLRVTLDKDSARIPPMERAIYEAYSKNAFNKVEESNRVIARLLDKHTFDLRDSITANLLVLQWDNFIKMYEYRKAAETGDRILRNFSSALEESKLKHIRNLTILYRAIASVGTQRVQQLKDEVIPWKKDKIGLINIPVRAGKQSYQFVFDTRASISTVTQTFARKLNLDIIDIAYEESSGITGNTFKTYPAVAESISIGDVVMRNVIFQVVPDEILAFPSAGYHIDGIIGFPVIKQWKEVHINQAGTITIPRKRTPRAFHNLAFDESTPVIALKTDVDTLSFHFDSGATSTMLYYNFLEKYRAQIINTARKEVTELGGAGGSKKTESYIYPVFGVYAGGERVELKDIEIRIAPTYPGQKYYGNIGQDLIVNFQETILNFEDMYLDFRKR